MKTMKNLLYFISLFLFISLTSCKKEPLRHKITYEVTFLNKPSAGFSNFIDISALPSDGQKPGVDRMNLPKIWRYEYYGLTSGEKVVFSVNGQLSYYFEMRLLIDDNEVSYIKAAVSDNTYYADHVIERRGINDYANEDKAIIGFTYRGE
jgi:hypothetical protein